MNIPLNITRVVFDMPTILICGQNLRYRQFLLICQAPPRPNIVEYNTRPQLWENTQIYNLSLKSPPPNFWVRTQTRNLSTYSNYLRYLCTYLKFVLKHLFDHLCIHLYFGVDFIMNLFIFFNIQIIINLLIDQINNLLVHFLNVIMCLFINQFVDFM